MIMWVEFELSAVFVYLYMNFTVQNIDTAFSPCRSIFEFREESTGVDHTLSFKQQVVTLIRVVGKDVYSMFVIVHQEFCQEVRSERRRRKE